MKEACGKGSTGSRTVKVLVAGTAVAAVALTFCGIVCMVVETKLLMSEHG